MPFFKCYINYQAEAIVMLQLGSNNPLMSCASSFRSSIGGSIRRSFRRQSKRGGSKRASQRSRDVYTNDS